MFEAIHVGMVIFLFLGGLLSILFGFTLKHLFRLANVKNKLVSYVIWFLIIMGLVIEIYLFAFQIDIVFG